MSTARLPRVGGFVGALVNAIIGCCTAPASAAETPKKDESAHRFYAGVTLGNLEFHDSYGGVGFSDTSVGLGVFGGVYLKDRLSLELSYDSLTAIDLHDLAGSGVSRFDVNTQRHTAAFSVVREVSMRDLFEWRRDWRFFGMAGVYRSSIVRTVSVLGAGEATSDDRITGALLGGGVLYQLGPVDLRGYFREFGVLGDKEAREFGVVVQRKF
jgi:hypothetical protein